MVSRKTKKKARRKKTATSQTRKSTKKKAAPKKKKKGRQQEWTRGQGRVPLQLQVQYRVKEKYLVDLGQDISPGGIFIRTENPLPKGTRVELSFSHIESSPSDPHITAEGKVVWSKNKKASPKDRYGMGIEFTRIDFEGQKFIDNIINDFLRKVSIF